MIRLLRSTAFRVALVFALALTASTGLVFALVAWRFYAADVAHVESVLRNEVAEALAEPLDRVTRRLETRLTQDLRHLDYVGLSTPDGAMVFGNVPPGFAVSYDGVPHLLAAPAGREAGATAVFVAGRRADGRGVVLGRSLSTVDELETAMRGAFALALLPVVLVALVAGTLVSRRAFRRLTGMERAIARVMAGELDARLPHHGTRDDVDSLAAAVNAMLDEVVRLIGQIKAVGDDIAHDLRAPLAAMRARMERGLGGRSDEALREATAAALDDLDRAMTTVDALLRISALECGVRRRAFARVDLAEVGRDAFELFEPLAQAKGLAMALDAPVPVVAAGDGDLLREALANLVDNAIKFTPPGGRVEIVCGAGAESLVLVRDTGPGVAAADRERIFRRFYRAASTRDLAPGNGLGLSMAATIVDLHGLELRVRDAAPGAIFEIARKRESARGP